MLLVLLLGLTASRLRTLGRRLKNKTFELVGWQEDDFDLEEHSGPASPGVSPRFEPTLGGRRESRDDSPNEMERAEEEEEAEDEEVEEMEVEEAEQEEAEEESEEEEAEKDEEEQVAKGAAAADEAATDAESDPEEVVEEEEEEAEEVEVEDEDEDEDGGRRRLQGTTSIKPMASRLEAFRADRLAAMQQLQTKRGTAAALDEQGSRKYYESRDERDAF